MPEQNMTPAAITTGENDKRRKSNSDSTVSPSGVAAVSTVAGPIAESSKREPEELPVNSVPDTTGDDQEQHQPPDGGAGAWLMVLGCWCCSFCTYGWINSVGIFQQYYETGPLRSYSASQIAWIASLQIFFMAFLGPAIGWLNDRHGPRWLIAGGTFLHVFGLTMASLSTTYYQILLAQGVCSAIGVACVFLPALMGVAAWFRSRRGLAFGLLSTGSSLGGVVFPILISHLLRTVGYAWAMRVCAFFILGLLTVANVFVRARIPPPGRAAGTEKTRRQSYLEMLAPFREPAFQLLLLGQFLIPFGIYIPITYLPTAAVAGGMDEALSQKLVTFYNAASLVGRLGSGYISDKLGKFNVFCLACLVSGALVLAMWIPSSGQDNVVVAFSVLYGIASGAYISLMAALVAQISPVTEVGYRNGLCFLFTSVGGLTTGPLAGAIMAGSGGWVGLKAFAGVIMIVGTLVTAAVRVIVVGWRLRAAF